MHLTQIMMNRAPKPDSFWRKRRIFKMSAVSIKSYAQSNLAYHVCFLSTSKAAKGTVTQLPSD